jgi:hypothetical protein
MKVAFDNLESRRIVWAAFSDLFLDTELDESLYENIARICIESPFSPEECEKIFWNEVYPVCIGNMLVPAGVWEAFDKEWLEAAIKRHVSTWRFRFFGQFLGEHRIFKSMVKEDWQRVQERIRVKREDKNKEMF